LLESKAIFVKTSIKDCRSFMVFLFLIAAFLTPSNILCQIVACLFIYLIIELTTFYALIIRVYKKQLTLFKPELRYGQKKGHGQCLVFIFEKIP
jgi:Sec-independent protein secretion pathway component TatC